MLLPTKAVVAALIVASLAPLPCDAQDAVADFYKGRQISIMVGFSPGGSSSLYAQALARHMGDICRATRASSCSSSRCNSSMASGFKSSSTGSMPRRRTSLRAPRQWRNNPHSVLRMNDFMDFVDIVLRLGAAVLAGAAIGVNRDLANKPIGMRTLALVALGAATIALAGIQVEGMAANPDALSRVVQGIIQGVMAGISFIGAGVILRDAKARMVEELTTAATVWVTAALGVACGSRRGGWSASRLCWHSCF